MKIFVCFLTVFVFQCHQDQTINNFDFKLESALNAFFEGNFESIIDLLSIDKKQLAPYFVDNQLDQMDLEGEYSTVDFLRKESLGSLTTYFYDINSRVITIPVIMKEYPYVQDPQCLIIDLLSKEQKLRYIIGKSYTDSTHPSIFTWNGGCKIPMDRESKERANDPFQAILNGTFDAESFEIRARNGDIEAMRYLGIYHDPDYVVSDESHRSDYREATYWFKMGAENNDMYSLEKLLEFLESGFINSNEVEMTRENLFDRIYALDACNPTIVKLAYYWKEKENHKEAEKFYEEAIDCSDKNAEIAYFLGSCYKSGYFGFEKDLCAAKKFYKKAMELGRQSAAFQYYRLEEKKVCENKTE